MEKEVQNDQLHPEATAHIVSNQNLKHITSQGDIQTSKKPRRKFHIPKIVILIGFFIILVVLIGGGAFMLGKNSSSTQVAETKVSNAPSPNPTTDWKTFIDSAKTFSIKHPPEWTTLQNETLVRFFPPGVEIENGLGPNVSDSEQISIYVTDLNPLNCKGDCPLFNNPKPFKVAGINTMKYTGRDGQMATMCACNYEKVIIMNGDSYYLFELNGKPAVGPNFIAEPISEESKAVFYNMLSTFEFNNSASKIITQSPTSTPLYEVLSIKEANPPFIPSNYTALGNNKMTVNGTGFIDGAKVTIEGPYDLGSGEVPEGETYRQYYLENVSVTKTIITGTIPDGLPEGYFRIVVKNPDGGSASTGLSLLRGSSPN